MRHLVSMYGDSVILTTFSPLSQYKVSQISSLGTTLGPGCLDPEITIARGQGRC